MRTWRSLRTWNKDKGFCFDSAKVCPVTFRPPRISWRHRKHNRRVGVRGRERGSCFSSPRLMTADGRMSVVMCEWAAEQRGVIPGGSRRSGACSRTLGVAYPEIGLTGASEHWRSESDCSCNFSYLVCFPLHLSLLNAHSSESGESWLLACFDINKKALNNWHWKYDICAHAFLFTVIPLEIVEMLLLLDLCFCLCCFSKVVPLF